MVAKTIDGAAPVNAGGSNLTSRSLAMSALSVYRSLGSVRPARSVMALLSQSWGPVQRMRTTTSVMVTAPPAECYSGQPWW
ncbi:hypothetical protein BaRGS_00014433 [Batillaria attramentaria]|uniref:Uncharacterized protein n=1 Tax=Batillaria attramentaria TaxID=370345 RepID=A0ABD0L4G2_9CAEN